MRNTIYNQSRIMPGGNEFESMQQIHADNKKKIYRKGFTFALGVGTNNFPIVLSGDARHLIGFVVYDATGDPANLVSLTINNLNIVEAVSQAHLSRIFGTTGLGQAQSNPLVQEVVPINVALSGEDAMTYQCTAGTAGNQYVVFLYTCSK